MEKSLFYLIIFLVIFLTLFVFYLLLSTCLGDPLRQLISSWWERLLDHADRQPTRRNVRRQQRGILRRSGGGLAAGMSGRGYSRLDGQMTEMYEMEDHYSGSTARDREEEDAREKALLQQQFHQRQYGRTR